MFVFGAGLSLFLSTSFRSSDTDYQTGSASANIPSGVVPGDIIICSIRNGGGTAPAAEVPSGIVTGKQT